MSERRRRRMHARLVGISILLLSAACVKPNPVEVELAWQAIEAAEEAARVAEAYRPTRQQRISYDLGIREAKEAHEEGDYPGARALAQDAQLAALRVRAEQERARSAVVDRMERVRVLAMEVHDKPSWGLDLERLFAAVQEEVERGQMAYDAGDYATASHAADQAIEYLVRRRALFQEDIEVIPHKVYLDGANAAEDASNSTSTSTPAAAVDSGKSGASASDTKKATRDGKEAGSEDEEEQSPSFLRRLRDSMRGSK